MSGKTVSFVKYVFGADPVRIEIFCVRPINICSPALYTTLQINNNKGLQSQHTALCIQWKCKERSVGSV